MSARREALWLGVIVAVAIGSLLAFAALDRRSPNDHDAYFTDGSIDHLERYLAAEGLSERGGILVDHFLTGGPHPRLPQTVLVATLGTFGPSRFAYRMANLPFAVLLVLGTWLLGRQLGGSRAALAAAALVTVLPVVVQHTRKFIPPLDGASLTPLAWALLLITLRRGGRAGWAAAAGAGLVQAARCYCHPVILPDVGLSSALVILAAAVLAFRARDRASRAAVARVCFAGGLGLLLTTHLLGLTDPWLTEPGYSLPNYIAAKSHIVGEPMANGIVGFIGVGWRFASEAWRMTLFPTGFVLLLAGLVAATRRWFSGPSRGRLPALLLVSAASVQVPMALLAVSRGTFTSDWSVLWPGICVVGTWGLFGDGERVARWAGAWMTLLAVHAAIVLLTPFALMAGPKTSDDPGWYRQGIAGAFAQSTTGYLWNTHMIPVREDLAGETLTAALGAQERSGFALVDLTRRRANVSTPCLVAGDTRGRWVWGPADPQNAAREWMPWPFVFHGASRQPPDPPPPDVVSMSEGRTPQANDAIDAWLTRADHPPTVVRLWAELPDEVNRQWKDCRPSRGTQELVDSARRTLQESLGDYRIEAELWDLGGELMGMENEADRPASYLSRAFLLMPVESEAE